MGTLGWSPVTAMPRFFFLVETRNLVTGKDVQKFRSVIRPRKVHITTAISGFILNVLKRRTSVGVFIADCVDFYVWYLHTQHIACRLF
jgi:hypothetical protein